MATTIRDVAKHAGVSISTVSRVLNNTCAVAEDKRERVQIAARDLGYVPNPNARSLLMKSTGGIGILLPHVSGEFFSEFLTGSDMMAKNNDFFLLISASHHKASEWRAAVQSVYKRVDGLVVMAPQLTPSQLNLATDVPTIFVNTPVAGGDRENVDVINFDNAGGVREATNMLLELGHKRFVYLAGPERAFDARERTRGFTDAMHAAGVSDYTILQAGYDQSDGREAAAAIARMNPRPTAVLAANDYCALGALAGLLAEGIRVPEDLSLVGFDNVPSAGFSMPPLTSVAVPIRQIGEQALTLLIKRIREPEEGSSTMELPVEVVVRDTTAPPPNN